MPQKLCQYLTVMFGYMLYTKGYIQEYYIYIDFFLLVTAWLHIFL
jgi:hypothetical protein